MQYTTTEEGFIIEVEYCDKDIYPAAYVKSFALAKEFKCKFGKGIFQTNKFFFHYDIDTMDQQTVELFADNMALFKEELKRNEILMIEKSHFCVYVGVDVERAMIYYNVTVEKSAPVAHTIREYILYLWKQISEAYRGSKGQIIFKRYKEEYGKKRALAVQFDVKNEKNRKAYEEIEKLICQYKCGTLHTKEINGMIQI